MALLQDAIVTALALWAALVVLRRVAGFVRPPRAGRSGGPEPGCANCPSATAPPRPIEGEHPVVFIRSRR